MSNADVNCYLLCKKKKRECGTVAVDLLVVTFVILKSREPTKALQGRF